MLLLMQGATLTYEDLTLISQLGHLIVQRPPGQTLCHQVRSILKVPVGGSSYMYWIVNTIYCGEERDLPVEE